MSKTLEELAKETARTLWVGFFGNSEGGVVPELDDCYEMRVIYWRVLETLQQAVEGERRGCFEAVRMIEWPDPDDDEAMEVIAAEYEGWTDTEYAQKLALDAIRSRSKEDNHVQRSKD